MKKEVTKQHRRLVQFRFAKRAKLLPLLSQKLLRVHEVTFDSITGGASRRRNLDITESRKIRQRGRTRRKSLFGKDLLEHRKFLDLSGLQEKQLRSYFRSLEHTFRCKLSRHFQGGLRAFVLSSLLTKGGFLLSASGLVKGVREAHGVIGRRMYAAGRCPFFYTHAYSAPIVASKGYAVGTMFVPASSVHSNCELYPLSSHLLVDHRTCAFSLCSTVQERGFIFKSSLNYSALFRFYRSCR